MNFSSLRSNVAGLPGLWLRTSDRIRTCPDSELYSALMEGLADAASFARECPSLAREATETRRRIHAAIDSLFAAAFAA